MRTGATLTPVDNLPDETARRIRGMIKVRDVVREVLRTQLQDHGDEAILDARRQLNFAYDHFVSRFGAINESANRRAFRGDPDLPLLCSLEDYNDETKRAAKTAIFRERTIQQAQRPRAAETPQDALVLALNETGRADFARMEALLSRPPEEFLPELKGLVYRNPQTEQWETDDQYLSGDVRTKLENARAAAAADPSLSGERHGAGSGAAGRSHRVGNRRAPWCGVDSAGGRGSIRQVATRQRRHHRLARGGSRHLVHER